MPDEISSNLFERACRVMPGGVNSPVRAFGAVTGDPVFVREAQGAELVGADGTRYVDYCNSFGPMIVGHAHPTVVEAVQQAAARGTSYGAPTEGETRLAETAQRLVPSLEMMRLVSSGTEAVMGALRAARGYTGRDLVLKFQGCYHGGADYLLVAAGSGAATFGVPTSAGVPEPIASTTLVLPFNDLDAVREMFQARGSEIAAVIVEPVAGNMGCVLPEPGFLEGLRELTEKHGSVLVFDEVMTGFRLAPGGAQERFGVTPDMSTFGKIVGGGLPVGLYGGKREIMEKVSPLGPVYQAGTLSGNPLAVAAGMATLRLLSEDDAYGRLETRSRELQAILEEEAERAGVAVSVQRCGSMITPYFSASPVRSFQDAQGCDTAAFARWHGTMLENGVYWPPAQLEAAFVSLAHGDAELSRTREAARRAFAAV